MDQVEDYYYCCEPNCKAPNKIITSFKDQFPHHNSHKMCSFSELRNELKELYTDTHPIKSQKDNKDELLSYIDQEL